MKVIIIGAGLGGLACAIACSQEGLDVIVLERAPEILPIGAGIQVASNASKVARHLGFLPALLERGLEPERLQMRRYDNGKVIHERLGRKSVEDKHGAPWFVIHRADYHEVMMEVAKKAGVDIRLDCCVEDIDFDKTQAIIAGGAVLSADVIIGADGLWSKTRELLLGYPSPPIETGDLAYRATVPREHLMALHDPRTDAFCTREVVTSWLGPQKHCILYPVRGGAEFNLVLIRPDNMPSNERTAQGDLGEMRKSFEGWDEILTMVLSRVQSVAKWKLCHHEELARWTKGAVALLGDACHPTLPYQGQGAAMSVEDGATLGKLLGSLGSEESLPDHQSKYIPEILRLYETRRKSRTTLNVRGAIENRLWYHLEDGPMQEKRDLAFGGGLDETGWCFIQPGYRSDLLGFDAVADSVDAYRSWLAQKKEAPRI